jgi:mannosyltransferase
MLAAGCIYSFHIGRTLGASEAYSAMAAAQPSYGAVIHTALRFDQGKPPLYQILLHSLVVMFGDGETVLRLPSVISSMISVGLLLALGNEMLTPAIGVAAAVLWALSPPAIVFAAWARMYAMLIALALGQLLVLWQLRSRPTPAKVIGCGVLGAAMLFTHLGGVLFLGVEAALLTRAARRGERTRAAWTALLLAAIAFVPFLPLAASQVHQCLYGHWLDWIGPAHNTSLMLKAAAFTAAGVAAAALTFGPRREADEREPIRWCAAIGLIPIIALAAGSIAIRPMLTIRYIAPSLSVTMLLMARLLASLGERIFRLATVGIAVLLLCLLPYYPRHDPWRDMARMVAAASPGEPVFFESGYEASTAQTAVDQGFPQGFFRVPFARYFSGANPRRVVNPSTPGAARQTIANAAAARGGAWLVSGLGDD